MWPALEKVNVLYRGAFMDVDDVVTMTDLDSRRRLKTALTMIFGNDPCEILHSKYMINARVPAVNSASDSIMVIADLKIPDHIACKDVIFKITFESKTKENQYQIEALVYYILSQFSLPFVMQHYKTYNCPNFSRVLQHESKLIKEMKQRWTKLSQYQSQYYDFEKAQIIVSERGGGSNLLDAIASVREKDKNISDEDWIAIFIQVMFCLAYFEELGIMHHDLHLGNIWLDMTDQKVKYRLNITKTEPKQPIVFSTRYIVKIYDFDHATIVETEYRQGSKSNVLLEKLCDMVGECNTMRPGRDYAQFCWWIHVYANDLLPQMVKETIAQSVNRDFLQNKAFDQVGALSWSGHPCIKTEKVCRPYSTKSVVEMISNISRSNILRDRGSTDHGSESTLYLPSYEKAVSNR